MMATKRGLHKIMQNLFVMKSDSLQGAKAIPKCTPKPRLPAKLQAKKPPSSIRLTNVSDQSSSVEARKALKWKRISFLGAFPAIGLMAGFVFYGRNKEPEEERPPFVKYEYMRIRHKRFPWGDGQKTFFHNPEKNPLPDGYEDEDESE